MSEDSFSDGFDNEYVRLEDSTIEINIKTLMGTTFTLKVSSSETIGDVKRKIYRIEGEYCLSDLIEHLFVWFIYRPVTQQGVVPNILIVLLYQKIFSIIFDGIKKICLSNHFFGIIERNLFTLKLKIEFPLNHN